MKIRSLELYRVGSYQGEVFSSLSDGFTVIYGLNEAGKSTLLGGVRGLLFGKALLSEGNPNVENGAFGRMKIMASAGNEFLLERSLAKKNPPKLYFPDGTIQSGQEVLTSVITELKEIEDTLFRSVFTFQLTDLVDKLDKNDTMQARLYGFSNHQQNPHRWEHSLDEEAKKIFNRDGRARNTEFLLISKQLDSLKEKLRETEDLPEDHARLIQELTVLREKIEVENKKLMTLENSLASANLKVDIYHLAVPMWTLLSERESMGTLPDIDISAYTVKVDTARQTISKAREKLRDYQGLELPLLIAARNQLLWNESLLESAEILLEWQNEAKVMNLKLQKLESFRRTSADASAQMQANQNRISSYWSFEAMKCADFTNAAVQRLRQWHEQVERIESENKLLLRKKLQFQLQLENAEAHFPYFSDSETCSTGLRHDQDVNMLCLQEIDQETALLDAWVATVQEWKRVEERLEYAPVETSKLKAPRQRGFVFASILTCGLAVVGGLLSHGVPAIPFYLLIVIGLSGLIVALRQPTGASDSTARQERPASRESERLVIEREQLESKFAFLKPQGTSQSEILRMRGELREAKQRLETEKVRLAERLVQSETWKSSEYNLHHTLQEKSLNDTAYDAVKEQWGQWLKHTFSTSEPLKYQISDVLADYPHIVGWRDREVEWQSSEENVHLLTEELDFVCETWNAIRQRMDLSILTALPEVSLNASLTIEGRCATVLESIAELGELLEAQQMLARQANEIELKIIDMSVRISDIQTSIHAEETMLGQLFTDLNVDSFPAFVKRKEQLTRAQEIDVKVAQSYHQLVGRCAGQRELADELLELVRHLDIAILTDALHIAKAECDATKVTIQDLHDERRLAELKCEAAQNSVASLDLHWQIEQCKEGQKRSAHEWAKRVLARKILQSARQTYEETHQSQTLTIATEIFNEITDGRYRMLQSRTEDDGTLQLYVVDSAGDAWTKDRLSRGTREQIQLALRLATIQAYRAQGIEMPIILDDPLVNFDASRTERYLDIFGRFANRGQVVLLTCHPHVRDLAVRMAGANVITLD